MKQSHLFSAEFGDGENGEVTVFLGDYDGSNHTEIGNGSLVDDDWQGGSTDWVNKTLAINGLGYTIPAGNELEIKLIVESNADDDMWFAYDTTSYPSVVKIEP